MTRKTLVELRGDRTRVKVAKDIGITPQGLGMIERGERTPSLSLAKKIADHYEVSIEDIFFKQERHKVSH